MQKKLTILFAFAIFVLVLGWAITPVQANPADADGCHNHKPCDGGGGDGDEPIIEPCPGTPMFCIADVGLQGTAPETGGKPSNHYAREKGGGNINISSPKFEKILQALEDCCSSDSQPAQLLCDAYDVLIFNWGSPKIKNLNWQRLLEYMACGGGVIFEDQNNVGALANGVSTIEVTRHTRGEISLLITLELELEPVLTSGFDSTANFVNTHIIFADNQPAGLTPFLTLPEDNDRVVGLFGEFPVNGGRIVLTGPDNNYHGYPGLSDERINHYNLMFNEINWLLN